MYINVQLIFNAYCFALHVMELRRLMVILHANNARFCVSKCDDIFQESN